MNVLQLLTVCYVVGYKCLALKRTLVFANLLRKDVW